MSMQIQHQPINRAIPALPRLPILPQVVGGVTGRMAALGGYVYDHLSPSIRLPVFTGLSYALKIALVVVPLVGTVASVKITYIALTALAIAVFLVVVRLTLKRGSSDELDANLWRWSSEGDLTNVIFASAAGADLEFRIALSGWTPLLAAHRHTAVVQALVQAGANINAQSGASQGYQTALMAAADAGSIPRIRALVGLGADVNARTPRGMTALMWAVSEYSQETLRELVSLGADVNARNNIGWTALMRAAQGGHEATLRTLIELEADVHARDNEGNTALMLAVDRGQRGIVQALIQAGAAVPDTYRARVTALTQNTED